MKPISYILLYIVLINVITFLAMAIDKHRAKKHAWRIPEALLIFLALIGGSAGGVLAMGIFHHKTMHKKFYIGMPLIFLVEFTGLLLYFWFWYK